MFGLIGHSTSFEDAKRKASMLGFDHIADGDLDVWCTAPPQLVENVEVKSATGISIEGSYIDSCFVPEMLSRFKTARRKVLNAMELASSIAFRTFLLAVLNLESISGTKQESI